MLKQVKVGDKVTFEAEEAASGYTVTTDGEGEVGLRPPQLISAPNASTTSMAGLVPAIHGFGTQDWTRPGSTGMTISCQVPEIPRSDPLPHPLLTVC